MMHLPRDFHFKEVEVFASGSRRGAGFPSFRQADDGRRRGPISDEPRRQNFLSFA
jgi:hypothetical protein